MNCEQCGGDCYDNRQKVAGGWKGPLLKCKDQDCGWKKWPPKGQQNQGGGRGAGATAARPTRPLGPLYHSCMKVARGTVQQLLGDNATPQDVIAATATIFIAAANSGAPIAPPPKPAPRPEPEPEPSQEYVDEDYPI